MSRLFQMGITVRDAKGATSVISAYLKTPDSIDDPNNDPAQYAADYALAIDNMINGQVVSISLAQVVALPVGLKSSPLSDSDVEESAKLVWRTDNNTTVRQLIPSITEDLFAAHLLNTSLTPVSDFIELVTHPEDLPADWNVAPCSNRGEDIETLDSGKKNFTSSRSFG